MKIILSYLLLFLYAMFIIKPVMPTIADAFAHLLNYSDHIATVHHEHGKYHVHFEYQEASKKSSSEKEPGFLKKDFTSSEYLMSGEDNHVLNYVSLKEKYFLSTYYLAATDLSHDYPPPRA